MTYEIREYECPKCCPGETFDVIQAAVSTNKSFCSMCGGLIKFVRIRPIPEKPKDGREVYCEMHPAPKRPIGEIEPENIVWEEMLDTTQHPITVDEAINVVRATQHMRDMREMQAAEQMGDDLVRRIDALACPVCKHVFCDCPTQGQLPQ